MARVPGVWRACKLAAVRVLRARAARVIWPYVLQSCPATCAIGSRGAAARACSSIARAHRAGAAQPASAQPSALRSRASSVLAGLLVP